MKKRVKNIVWRGRQLRKLASIPLLTLRVDIRKGGRRKGAFTLFLLLFLAYGSAEINSSMAPSLEFDRSVSFACDHRSTHFFDDGFVPVCHMITAAFEQKNLLIHLLQCDDTFVFDIYFSQKLLIWAATFLLFCGVTQN